MSNFIPLSAERAMARSHVARICAGTGLVMLACSLAAGIALIPAYISLHAEQEALTRQKDVFSASIPSLRANPDRVHIARAQALVTALKPIGGGVRVAEAMNEIVNALPVSISLTRITYDAGTGSLVLFGEASQREHLSAYRETLRALHVGSSVSIPLEEIAGVGKGTFTVTISGVK